MHDYYILEDNWYSGFLKFGNDWDISMNVIENKYFQVHEFQQII